MKKIRQSNPFSFSQDLPKMMLLMPPIIVDQKCQGMQGRLVLAGIAGEVHGSDRDLLSDSMELEIK